MTYLTRQEMGEIKLPAWAPLLVKGDPVSVDQAAEILLRTDNFYFSTRDVEWEKQLNIAIGVTQNVWTGSHEERVAAVEARDRARFRCRLLTDLRYLYNRRVASSAPRGPHGWLDWDGSIFCNSYMIGKHATTEEMYDEWLTIAKEWPFLHLRCQLLDVSIGATLPQFLVDYVIKDGQVKAYRSTSFLIPYATPSDNDAIPASLRAQPPQSERGCTFEQFMHGLRLVEKSSTRSETF